MKTTLAERIKEALNGPPKRTSKALAEACGVRPPSVSDWLNGRTKTIEGSHLLAAAEFLGVRARWLADGVGSKHESDRTVAQEQSAPYALSSLAKKTTAVWPFELIDQQRYEALSLALQHKAQVRMNDVITELLAEQETRANAKTA